MKILLYGLGKTGTSALAYGIHKAMQVQFENATLFFEPRERPDNEPDNCIVKTLFDNPFDVMQPFKANPEGYQPQNNILHYSDYDKIVITVRCKRDRLISMFLYAFFKDHGLPQERFFKTYVQVLAKETFGNKISFSDLVNEGLPGWLPFVNKYYELYNKHIAEAVRQMPAKIYFIAYEDIYNKNFTELNKFLGLNVSDPEITDKEINYRVKRSGEAEQWKRWFNEYDRKTIFPNEYPECNEYLPVLPEHGSQYLKKIGDYDIENDYFNIESQILQLKKDFEEGKTFIKGSFLYECMEPILKKSYPNYFN